jgi:hypothetical protein
MYDMLILTQSISSESWIVSRGGGLYRVLCIVPPSHWNRIDSSGLVKTFKNVHSSMVWVKLPFKRKQHAPTASVCFMSDALSRFVILRDCY